MDAFVQRVLDAYNGQTLDAFDSLLTDDVVLERDEEKAHGRDAFKAVVAQLRRAFPDMQYRIRDVVSSGDKVALRWENEGTHMSEYLGVQGTRRRVSYSGITLYELRDGRIARAWVAADLLSLLRRLHEGRSAAAPEARA
jgi:steroid delta-isomerase-like uncharacterized protein